MECVTDLPAKLLSGVKAMAVPATLLMRGHGQANQIVVDLDDVINRSETRLPLTAWIAGAVQNGLTGDETVVLHEDVILIRRVLRLAAGVPYQVS